MRIFGAAPGKPCDEAGAFVRFAAHHCAAAMQLRQPPHHRQAQAGAFILARMRRIDLRKRLEQFLQAFLAHADAGIAHADLEKFLMLAVRERKYPHARLLPPPFNIPARDAPQSQLARIALASPFCPADTRPPTPSRTTSHSPMLAPSGARSPCDMVARNPLTT